MGSFNANILPTSTGLNLGSSVQEWNAYIDNLVIGGSIAGSGFGFSSVSFSPTPIFDGSQGGVFEIILTADVTSSTTMNLITGWIYTFIIIQDVVGAHAFSWPTQFKGTMVIDPTASINNVQQFVFDGTTAFAVSPGVSM